MSNFTPTEIMTTVLAVASAIVLLSNAAEKIAKAVKTAKAPNARQDERLAAMEKNFEELERYLSLDKKRLDRLDSSSRATQRALLALLDHGIDGNNVQQMQSAKEELQNLLINQ